MTRGLSQVRMIAAAALATVVLAAAAMGGCGGPASPAAPDASIRDGEGGGGPTTAASSGAAPAPASAPESEGTKTPKATPAAAATAEGSHDGSAAGASPALRVVFVDVGQGDAAVLRSGSWTGLIDGGPAGSEGAIEAALAKLSVRRLDTLVISHLHADHAGGLPAVVAEYRPRRAWVAGAVRGGLATALRRAGTVVEQARRGLSQRLGRARATVLAPSDVSGDANRDSVVLEIDAAGRRVVFTGDCSGAGETAAGAVLARGPPVDVLKVSHHGSRSSTTADFLAGARPRVAVISVGRNSYGHPSNEAVQRLLSAGARVFTTKRSGSITLTVTDGGSLRWDYARSAAPITKGVSGAGSSSSSSGGSAAASTVGATSPSTAAGGTTVYVTETGECYHLRDCRYLASSRIAITLSRAKGDGYRPCSVCDPPR